LATLAGRTLTVASGVSAGTVVVSVSFPTYSSASALVCQHHGISVVDVAGGLALTSSPNSVMRQYQCTTAYQRVGLSSSATLTNGATYALTAYTAFASNSSAVATVGGSTVQGVAPGVVTLTGTFQAAVAGSVHASVSGSPATLCPLQSACPPP
jgi:hypothetical protein